MEIFCIKFTFIKLRAQTVMKVVHDFGKHMVQKPIQDWGDSSDGS